MAGIEKDLVEDLQNKHLQLRTFEFIPLLANVHQIVFDIKLPEESLLRILQLPNLNSLIVDNYLQHSEDGLGTFRHPRLKTIQIVYDDEALNFMSALLEKENFLAF